MRATAGLLLAAGIDGVVNRPLKARILTGVSLSLLLLGVHPLLLLGGTVCLGSAGLLNGSERIRSGS